MNNIDHVPGILVVGAGYAGLHAASSARSAGVPVTVVDDQGLHGFTTRLAAVAGGTSPEGDAFAPLEAFGHPVRRGRVAGLDDGIVELDDGTTLEAEAVIVTAGARAALPDLPGIDLALPLRSPADAIGLRRRLDSLHQLSIIGGGATGAQLAGAVAVSRPDLSVRIIDREPRLLNGMGRSLSDRAEQILVGRNVELHLECELDRIEPGGLTLSDGRSFDGPVVWAGGFESVISELGESLPDDEGRLQVEHDLRIAGWERTFAAGDVAAHRTRDGELLPMAAQIAVQAGTAAGRNAARLIDGDDPERAALVHRGWVMDLGGGQGVAQLGPVPLASVAQLGPVPLATTGLDRLPPLLHHAIDLKHLLEIAGPGGLRFAPGRHRPSAALVEQVLAVRDPEPALSSGR